MAVRLSSGFKALSAHKITVKDLPLGDIIVLESWIKDNCDGEYYISPAYSYTTGIAFYLWDDVDAMAFKLRWL